jgi:hypothetical protein
MPPIQPQWQQPADNGSGKQNNSRKKSGDPEFIRIRKRTAHEDQWKNKKQYHRRTGSKKSQRQQYRR